MNRFRSVLYEIAIIVLTGVAIALIVTGAMRYMHRPTLADFKREYAAAKPADQVAVVEKYVDQYSPKELLRVLEQQYTPDNCHAQGHAIGRVIYKRDPNVSSAIAECGNACTFGCFHGVIMELFDTESDTLGGVINEDSSDAYLTHVKAIAHDICTRPELQTVVRSRQCYHGIGHVYTYLSNRDLKAATASCDTFAPYEARSCRSGAFMEYIYNATSTSAEYAKSAKPCDAFPKDTYNCYRYKAYSWLRAYGSVAAAMSACDAFGVNTIHCISSTATAASSRILLSKEKGIDQICGTLRGEKQRACIVGAFLKITDLDDSQHICDGVTPAYRDDCVAVLKKFGKEDFQIE